MYFFTSLCLKYLTAPLWIYLLFVLHMCVCLSPPPDAPTTPPPSTTPPLHPIPSDPTALLGTHVSDSTVTGNRGTVPHASQKLPHYVPVYSHFPLPFTTPSFCCFSLRCVTASSISIPVSCRQGKETELIPNT